MLHIFYKMDFDSDIEEEFLRQAHIRMIDGGTSYAKCKKLIEAGLDIKSWEKNHFSTIHIALVNEYSPDGIPLLRLFISEGANVNYQSYGGETVLMEAIKYGNPEYIKMLLDAGADPYLTNCKGINAMLCLMLYSGGDYSIARFSKLAMLTDAMTPII